MDRHSEPADAAADEGPDFGLLVAIALAESVDVVAALRKVLAANGIRSTVAPRPDGRTRILVFRENAARARRLVRGVTD